jgi:hypothetical protein
LAGSCWPTSEGSNSWRTVTATQSPPWRSWTFSFLPGERGFNVSFQHFQPFWTKTSKEIFRHSKSSKILTEESDSRFQCFLVRSLFRGPDSLSWV